MRYALAAVLAASLAQAQTVVHGITASGDVIRIDPATGAGSLLGRSGVQVAAGASANLYYGNSIGTAWTQHLPIAFAAAPQAGFKWVSPCTGAVMYDGNWTPPEGTTVNAAADDGTSVYLVQATPAGEMLARLEVQYDPIFTEIGPTGRGDLVALAKNSAGTLYALGTDSGGALCTLNPATGAATLVAPCAFGDARSMAFLPDGTLLVCGSSLMRIDPATGAGTVVGPTGHSEVRGLSVTPGCTPPVTNCYANCDGSWNPPPILNVQDFACFLYRFAHGDPYANCDGSTIQPYLNVNDFACFLNRFMSGCL
jgi:hypothetical protein